MSILIEEAIQDLRKNGIYTNPGIFYLRLKTIDFDGSIEYSEVKSVQFEQKEISIFPNPVTNKVNINSSNRTEISIFNQLGQLMEQVQLGKGKNELNLNQYQSGIYIFRTGSGTQMKVIKM